MNNPFIISFKKEVLIRANYRCEICGFSEAVAHQIICNELFNNGGFHINNGVALCISCQNRALKTQLSVRQLREAAQISDPLIPPGFNERDQIDRWGNVILPNKLRMHGPLFGDPRVAKFLEDVHFTDLVRYPSTPHFPWSANVTAGTAKRDRVLANTDHFLESEMVVTEKMDGENTTIYHGGYCHARSPDGGNHSSRDWVKALAAKIGWEIPKGWRICGENLYAKHSVYYEDLSSYFQLFSIWDENNRALSWTDTLEWAQLLGVQTVHVIYRGRFDEQILKKLANSINTETSEGYVARITDGFSYHMFPHCVAKWVRPFHVQTSTHWMNEKITINRRIDPKK